jgi:hypothetical protein
VIDVVWDKDMGVALRIEGSFRTKAKIHVIKMRQHAVERGQRNLCFKCDNIILEENKKRQAQKNGGFRCDECEKKGYEVV